MGRGVSAHQDWGGIVLNVASRRAALRSAIGGGLALTLVVSGLLAASTAGAAVIALDEADAPVIASNGVIDAATSDPAPAAGVDDETTPGAGSAVAGAAGISESTVLQFPTPYVGRAVTLSNEFEFDYDTETVILTWYVGGKVAVVGDWPYERFTPTLADVGKTLQARLQATVEGGQTFDVWSLPQTIRLGVLDASSFIVYGEAKVGELLQVDGTWWTQQYQPATLQYQWLRDGAKISGATKANYTVSSKDIGKRIGVRVTGSAEGHETLVRTHTVGKVVKGTFRNPVSSVLSGDLLIGATLVAPDGTWLGNGTTLKYQWYVEGKAVKGATKRTFKLPGSAYGKFVSVRVTVTKSGYNKLVWRFSAIDPVDREGELYVADGSVLTLGELVVGKKATVSHADNNGGFAPGTKFRYQWIDMSTMQPIPGATKASYTPTRDMAGKQVIVHVYGTKDGYVGKFVAVTPQNNYVANAYKTVTPTISGTAAVGKTLTASTGSWSPTPGKQGRADYTFQWLRNGVAIDGATGKTYTVTAADRGAQLQVRVSVAASGDYNTKIVAASKTSAKTAKVK